MSFRSNLYDCYNNISYDVRGKETSQSYGVYLKSSNTCNNRSLEAY